MKKICMTIICIFCFLLGACATGTISAIQEHPIKIWGQNENGPYHTAVVVDENTGVNYIVVCGEASFGDMSRCVAITPRLNVDGSLYVSE